MSKKKDVLEYALKYIYRYPKTEKELIAKLREKKYTEDEIKKAIEYLKRQWWVDDEKYVKMYIESELIKKWKPIRVVKLALYRKGVSKDIIDKVFEIYNNEIKGGIYSKISNEIKKYKLKWYSGFDIIQKLLSRWYYLKDIKKVLDDMSNEG